MFECDTKLTKECQKEMLKPSFIVALIFIIAGGAGLLLTLIYDVIVDSYDMGLLSIFALLLGLGIGIEVLLKQSLKRFELKSITNHYTFQQTFMVIDSSNEIEIIGASKIYYKDLKMAKISGDYILLYVEKITAYPVEIKALGDANKTLLFGLLKAQNVKIVNKK